MTHVVACAQLDVAWEDRPANHAKAAALLDATPPPGGSLLVLPEMFPVGFTMNVNAAAEPDARPTQAVYRQWAAAHDVTVVGGQVTRGQDGRGRNEAVAVGPGGDLLARYVKLHPFSFAGETEHYTAGDQIVTFAWHDWTEALRAAVRRGADLFVVIANWPAPRVEHWTTLLRARAIENQAVVVGVNRVGRDPNVTYPGRSMVIGPDGRTIAEAGDDETLLLAEIDHDALQSCRADFPVLRDMRDDL